jgi:uncharacterized protein YcfJ
MDMKNRLLTIILTFCMLLGVFAPNVGMGATRYDSRAHYYRHRRHVKTAKRVGIGAAGGAVIGALAGGGKGAGIGTVVGAGAGYLYDRHKRHHHRYYYYYHY